MELEQRVKTLEYELKILKNEVQRTLLEIHEQILVHYYPTLRAEDAIPSEGIVQAIEETRAKQGNFSAAPTTAAPAVKKTSLDEVRSAQKAAPAVAPAEEQVDLVGLSAWMVSSAGKIGSGRARKIVQSYEQKGMLSPEAGNVLLQNVEAKEESAPPKVTDAQILHALTELEALLGREGKIEETLALIKEVSHG